MDYLKIAEVSHKCEAIRQTISQYYATLGAHSNFDEKVKDTLYAEVDKMKSDLQRQENKLKKLCK